MTTALNMTWYRGETEEWVLTVTNADGTASDLSTALAVEFEVKQYRGAPDPAALHLDASASPSSGITIRSQVTPNVGVCDVVASPAQTFALAAGIWHYDVWVKRADSARKLVITGVLTVSEAVNFP